MSVHTYKIVQKLDLSIEKLKQSAKNIFLNNGEIVIRF